MSETRRTGPDRKNSFDAVRLVAALAVVMAHQLNIAGYTLSEFSQPSLGPGGPKLADAGLYVFFALSGYLVFRSLDGDPRTIRFLSARALRIYPGVFVNVMVCLLFGAAITRLPPIAYWNSTETWSFLAHNASILITPTLFQLPGAMVESPWPSVNVPLWTLKYEILCYLVLLAAYKLIGVFGRRYHRPAPRSGALIAFAVVMVVCFVYERNHPGPSGGGLDTLGNFSEVHVIRFFAVFFSGAAYAGLEPWTDLSRIVVATLLGGLVLTGLIPEIRFVATVLTIGFAAIELGKSRLLYSRIYHRVGDLSYGTYLYAFPIQMLTLSRWLNANNFWVLTLLDVVLALACATLSWRLVERPALGLKPGRRQGDRLLREQPAAPSTADGPPSERSLRRIL